MLAAAHAQISNAGSAAGAARFRRIPVKDAAVKIKVRVPQRVGRVL